jgi:hypothetical protein
MVETAKSTIFIDDLKLLMEMLTLPEFSPVWSCYIGLLIPRIATCRFLSDASYEGLRGWSPEFQIQWRLTKQDLIDVGFNMQIVDAITGEPDPEQKGLCAHKSTEISWMHHKPLATHTNYQVPP